MRSLAPLVLPLALASCSTLVSTVLDLARFDVALDRIWRDNPRETAEVENSEFARAFFRAFL